MFLIRNVLKKDKIMSRLNFPSPNHFSEGTFQIFFWKTIPPPGVLNITFCSSNIKIQGNPQ